jgi:hypothetical protein
MPATSPLPEPPVASRIARGRVARVGGSGLGPRETHLIRRGVPRLETEGHGRRSRDTSKTFVVEGSPGEVLKNSPRETRATPIRIYDSTTNGHTRHAFAQPAPVPSTDASVGSEQRCRATSSSELEQTAQLPIVVHSQRADARGREKVGMPRNRAVANAGAPHTNILVLHRDFGFQVSPSFRWRAKLW